MKGIGAFLIVVGIGVGLYVGGYLCFIGGIVQLIDAIRAEVLVASEIAWGIARILSAGLCGWLSAICFIIPGLAIQK